MKIIVYEPREDYGKLEEIDSDTYHHFDWDMYFLSMCESAAKKSPCLSRKIGAVLVNPLRVVIGTGYNGPPRHVAHCDSDDAFFMVYSGEGDGGRLTGDCPRKLAGMGSGEALDKCPAVHAEVNAVLAAAISGASTYNTTLYCFCGPPCRECAKVLINAGVRQIVCLDDGFYDYMSEWFYTKMLGPADYMSEWFYTKMLGPALSLRIYDREDVITWIEEHGS